jgi:hypothetical protein
MSPTSSYTCVRWISSKRSPIRGTSEDPMEPVFSPDSQWRAYFVPASGLVGTAPIGSNWVLKKIAVSGGAPVTLGQLTNAPFGATWHDRTIAFGRNTGTAASVQAIPDSGRPLRTVVTADAAKEQVMQPQLLSAAASKC